MADNDYEDYNKELINDIDIRANLEGIQSNECFFDIINEMLTENGEFRDTLTYTPYVNEYDIVKTDDKVNYKTNSIKVDGYIHTYEKDGINEISILLLNYNSSADVVKFNTSELDNKFKLAKRLIQQCSDQLYVNEISTANPGWPLIHTLCTNFKQINKITILLATNEEFSGRITKLNTEEFLNKRISYQLFDYKRFVELKKSKTGFAPIDIIFDELGSDPVDCLKTMQSSSDYQSYLIAMPAKLMTNIYEEYGSRLLEQNVRSFLQARGNVNKGIINTLKEEPEMFFAYNNGITATASDIEFDNITPNGVLKIKSIKNLQIVNGGQTTASMYYARTHFNIELSKIFVQMKLSVIDETLLETVVPKISRFANTQNAVNKADFFANHPFHVTFDGLCNKNMAPKKEEALNTTYWFYERARGAYKDLTAYKTKADIKRITEKYPSDQVLLKTDISKYVLTFDMSPHIVCKGAQNAFLSFSKTIPDETAFSEKKHHYNTLWFKEIIAKAIIYKTVDKLIITKKNDWYTGSGTKAVTNTYSIAWIVKFLKEKKLEIDFISIWKNQQISKELYKMFEIITENVFQTIKENDEKNHLLEFAKTKKCWDIVKLNEFDIAEALIPKISISSKIAEKNRLEAAKIGASLDRTSLYIKLTMLDKETVDKIIEKARFFDLLPHDTLVTYLKINKKQLVENDVDLIKDNLLELKSKISLKDIGVNINI